MEIEGACLIPIRWPAFSKPKDDELLSSWIVRLAMSHGLKLHTFCSLAWPKKAIWNRDIDKSADAEIMQTLSEKTGVSIERVHATSLAAYEGLLYEKRNTFGPSPWIMPIGVYHRTRTQFGLQYCPLCLSEDKEPYYRRKWRLAFMVICETHRSLLRDRCPKCEAAVNFHRNELGDYKKIVTTSMTHCHICNFDLRMASAYHTSLHPITPSEVEFTQKLLKAIDEGVVRINDMELTCSLLYFTVLRHLMKIVSMRNQRLDKLRQEISSFYGVESYIPMSGPKLDVQEQSLEVRRQLLQIVRYLLEDWPHRFIAIAQKHKVWSSLWLKHMESGPWERSQTAPFWFWRVVHDHLYRARYQPSEEETIAAVAYLKKNEAILNKSKLSRLLGIAFVRRRDIF